MSLHPRYMSQELDSVSKNNDISYGHIFENLDTAVVAARGMMKGEPVCIRIARLPQNKFTLVYCDGNNPGGAVVDSNQGNGRPFWVAENRILYVWKLDRMEA